MKRKELTKILNDDFKLKKPFGLPKKYFSVVRVNISLEMTLFLHSKVRYSFNF